MAPEAKHSTPGNVHCAPACDANSSQSTYRLHLNIQIVHACLCTPVMWAPLGNWLGGHMTSQSERPESCCELALGGASIINAALRSRMLLRSNALHASSTSILPGLALATEMHEFSKCTVCSFRSIPAYSCSTQCYPRRPAAACPWFHSAIHVLAALAERRTPWLAMTYMSLAAPFCAGTLCDT
jgi:hypothetical protein